MPYADPLEADIGKRRKKCYLCKQRTPGELCHFWAGFCEQYDRTDLVTEIEIRYKFRDMHRYSVTVCDDCAARIRFKKHLPAAIAWGIGAVGCAVGIIVASAMRVGGDGLVSMYAVLWFFTALCAMMALLSVWEMKRGVWSPEVTRDVLKKVKRDPKYKKRGDTFFTPEEYRFHYPESEDEPLTAEEILARDRTGGYG